MNVVAGLGTGRDRASYSTYRRNLVDNLATYEGSGLARKIVDAYGEGVTREWRTWHGSKDQIGALEATERRVGVSRAVEEAMHYSRLWGGGAILIGADTENPGEPLRPARIGRDELRYLTALTRYDLNAGPIIRDPNDPDVGKPEYWTLAFEGEQRRIHPSRVVVFPGVRRAQRNALAVSDPWGMSVLEAVYAELTGCDQAMQNALTLLFEANVDIFGIPEYAENYHREGEDYLAKVQARIGMAAMQKSNLKALIRDTQETYDRKAFAFTGIPDIIDRAQQYLAGVVGMPVSELFAGRQKVGLGGDADASTRSWYDTLRAVQKNEVAPRLTVLDEVVIRSSLGSRPAELYYLWAPLWQMTSNEKAELAKKNADTIKVLSDARLFDPDTLARAAVTALTETGALPGLEAAADAGDDLDDGQDDGAQQPGDDTPSNRRTLRDERMKPLYLSRPVVNADVIRKHYADQGIVDLVPAADMHVTIAYSRGALDWLRASSEYAGSNLEIGADAMRVHDVFGPMTDTLVLAFKSDSLRWRHQDLLEAGASWDFPDYTPHITLSKPFTGDEEAIKPYTGPIVLGPERAEQPKAN